MTLESFVVTYGYLALLTGALLEGETIVIIAGIMAHSGYLQLPWVIGVAFCGNTTQEAKLMIDRVQS